MTLQSEFIFQPAHSVAGYKPINHINRNVSYELIIIELPFFFDHCNWITVL